MAGQKRLGELLVEMGLIDEGQLESALDDQMTSGRRLGKILLDAHVIDEEHLARALAIQLGLDLCDPVNAPVHPRVTAMIASPLAHRYGLIPMGLTRDDAGQVLYVATADPTDRAAFEMLRAHLGAQTRVRWMVASEAVISRALERHYPLEAAKPGASLGPSLGPPSSSPAQPVLPPNALEIAEQAIANTGPRSVVPPPPPPAWTSAPTQPRMSAPQPARFQGAPVIQGVPISGPRLPPGGRDPTLPPIPPGGRDPTLPPIPPPFGIDMLPPEEGDPLASLVRDARDRTPAPYPPLSPLAGTPAPYAALSPLAAPIASTRAPTLETKALRIEPASSSPSLRTPSAEVPALSTTRPPWTEPSPLSVPAREPHAREQSARFADPRSLRAESSPPPVTNDLPRLTRSEPVRRTLTPSAELASPFDLASPVGPRDTLDRFLPLEELGIEGHILSPDEVLEPDPPGAAPEHPLLRSLPNVPSAVLDAVPSGAGPSATLPPLPAGFASARHGATASSLPTASPVSALSTSPIGSASWGDLLDTDAEDPSLTPTFAFHDTSTPVDAGSEARTTAPLPGALDAHPLEGASVPSTRDAEAVLDPSAAPTIASALGVEVVGAETPVVGDDHQWSVALAEAAAGAELPPSSSLDFGMKTEVAFAPFGVEPSEATDLLPTSDVEPMAGGASTERAAQVAATEVVSRETASREIASSEIAATEVAPEVTAEQGAGGPTADVTAPDASATVGSSAAAAPSDGAEARTEDVVADVLPMGAPVEPLDEVTIEPPGLTPLPVEISEDFEPRFEAPREHDGSDDVVISEDVIPAEEVVISDDVAPPEPKPIAAGDVEAPFDDERTNVDLDALASLAAAEAPARAPLPESPAPGRITSELHFEAPVLAVEERARIADAVDVVSEDIPPSARSAHGAAAHPSDVVDVDPAELVPVTSSRRDGAPVIGGVVEGEGAVYAARAELGRIQLGSQRIEVLQPGTTIDIHPEDYAPAPGLQEDRTLVRRALERLVAGEVLDAESSTFLVRVLATVLMNEGLFDDHRLERALETMMRKSGKPL